MLAFIRAVESGFEGGLEVGLIARHPVIIGKTASTTGMAFPRMPSTPAACAAPEEGCKLTRFVARSERRDSPGSGWMGDPRTITVLVASSCR
jgi:hypothetical protein